MVKRVSFSGAADNYSCFHSLGRSSFEHEKIPSCNYAFFYFCTFLDFLAFVKPVMKVQIKWVSGGIWYMSSLSYWVGTTRNFLREDGQPLTLYTAIMYNCIAVTCFETQKHKKAMLFSNF